MSKRRGNSLIQKSKNEQAVVLNVFTSMVEQLKFSNTKLELNSMKLEDERREIEKEIRESDELMNENISLIDNIEKIFKI